MGSCYTDVYVASHEPVYTTSMKFIVGFTGPGGTPLSKSVQADDAHEAVDAADGPKEAGTVAIVVLALDDARHPRNPVRPQGSIVWWYRREPSGWALTNQQVMEEPREWVDALGNHHVQYPLQITPTGQATGPARMDDVTDEILAEAVTTTLPSALRERLDRELAAWAVTREEADAYRARFMAGFARTKWATRLPCAACHRPWSEHKFQVPGQNGARFDWSCPDQSGGQDRDLPHRIADAFAAVEGDDREGRVVRVNVHAADYERIRTDPELHFEVVSGDDGQVGMFWGASVHIDPKMNEGVAGVIGDEMKDDGSRGLCPERLFTIR